MIQTRLKGMGVALITPFKEDESVDYDALMRLVDYLLQNNADFLCVLGTTAETPTLSEEEKKKIKKMDKDREKYYRSVTGMDWADARSYDLCLNTSLMGIQKSCDLVEEAVRIFLKARGIDPQISAIQD